MRVIKLFSFIAAIMFFFTIDANANQYTQKEKRLFDSNRVTKVTLNEGDEILISEDENIYGIYIVWDDIDHEIEIASKGKVQIIHSEGMLHHFSRLENPDKQLTIKILKAAVACDIYIIKQDDIPAQVEFWDPSLRESDLLLVSTHADDEHLFFGGIMPTYAGEKNMRVQVAYLTNHGITGEKYRDHELLSGLYAVGIRNYPLISDFKDLYADSLASAIRIYGEDNIKNYITDTIRYTKPKVVVGHDLNGEYGHGVHMLGADGLTKAIVQAADAEYISQLSPHQINKLYLHLYNENKIKLDYDIPLKAFGGKTAFEMAQEGYSYHISQHKWFKVERGGAYDNAAFGLYFSNVGEDINKNDLFENIS